jgi:hypothetical protein
MVDLTSDEHYLGSLGKIVRFDPVAARMAGASSGRDPDAWLAPFPTVMGRKTRRTWAPL